MDERERTIANLIAEASSLLTKAYTLLVAANEGDRQLDFTNAPDLGVDRLAWLVRKVERLYYQKAERR